MNQAATAIAAMITMSRSVRSLLSIAALIMSHMLSPQSRPKLQRSSAAAGCEHSWPGGRPTSAWPRMLPSCQRQNVLFTLEEVRLTNWRAEVEAHQGEAIGDLVWETLDSNGDVEDLQLGLITGGSAGCEGTSARRRSIRTRSTPHSG